MGRTGRQWVVSDLKYCVLVEVWVCLAVRHLSVGTLGGFTVPVLTQCPTPVPLHCRLPYTGMRSDTKDPEVVSPASAPGAS